jgi:peroxiredoxin
MTPSKPNILKSLIGKVLAFQFVFIFFCTANGAMCPCCVPDEGANLHVGEKIELLTVPLFDGDTLDLSKVSEDKIAFIFWATWCPTCQKEISQAGKITELFKKHDAFLMGVNMDFELESAIDFVDAYSVSFPNTSMSFELVDQFRSIVILPKLIIVDREGKVLSVSNPVNHGQMENALQVVE